jgi:hypothetical protein
MNPVIRTFDCLGHWRFWPLLPVAVSVLLLSVVLGTITSPYILALLVASIGAVVLIRQPLLGLLALVVAATLSPLQINTGTEVSLNVATLLVPALLALWMLYMVRQREVRLVPSRTNRPLWLFLLAGIISLLIGIALWDPFVPRSGNFIIVQMAQWAIFAFSAAAFWLTGNLVRDENWLRRLNFFFLALAGSLAILRVIPGTDRLVYQTTSGALERAPFWLLLTAVAGGQLLFHGGLSARWRLFLMAIIGAVLVYAFHLERATDSYWVGVAAVLGVLAWLRFPSLRWPAVILLLVLAATGILGEAVYEFAGGDAEWEESGTPRLLLIGRVVEVTMRNPITGIGPAAYRLYAKTRPLLIANAYYIAPWVSSHNNYVDLFSQVGLLGLGLFLWFAAEVILLGFRLRARFTQGFAAGYVNAMLAAWAGGLMLMLFADWMLPFVYNIGFHGFQASVLVWLFLGGLVVLENIANRESVG